MTVTLPLTFKTWNGTLKYHNSYFIIQPIHRTERSAIALHRFECEEQWLFNPVSENTFQSLFSDNITAQPPAGVILWIILTDFPSPLVKKWLTFPQYVWVVPFSASSSGNKNDVMRSSPNVYCQKQVKSDLLALKRQMIGKKQKGYAKSSATCN